MKTAASRAGICVAAALLLSSCDMTMITAPPVLTPEDHAGAGHGRFPAYGENPPVTVVPEVVTKVPPAYPDSAREAGVQGTVRVAALVCEHGFVVDTRPVESIPMLDAAARDAVLQWRYHPARNRWGWPVSYWVEVPIKFSLH